MIRDSRQRLFEMMNRVSGMPLVNENNVIRPNLPSWAMGAINDFIPREKYEKEVPCSTNLGEVERDLKQQQTKIDDPQAWLRDKDTAITAKKKQDVEGGGRLSPLMIAQTRKGDYNIGMDAIANKSNTYDSSKLKLPKGYNDNVEYDLQKLAEILSQKPSGMLGQNGKMEKSKFYNVTLPAFKGIFYDIEKKEFFVINVCVNAGDCAKICFAQMGNKILYDPPIRLDAQKLNYLLNYADSWKRDIISEINNLNDGYMPVVVRWHDSGDFFSEEYMKLAFEVARETKFAEHYAYTKEIRVARRLGSETPNNFEFKFSFGGKDDDLIDKTKDAHAVVVPPKIFNDLRPIERVYNKRTKKWVTGPTWNFSPESFEELKNRIADEYKLDRNTILTNKELSQIEYHKENPRKWNVIGVTGENDVPALRRDVLGVYLLQHR